MRSHYFWIGGSLQRYSRSDSGDRLGSVKSYSLVYGYRPPALRLDYPKPDLRFFVEAVGEATDHAQHAGAQMRDTGGPVMMVGPTALLSTRRMVFPVAFSGSAWTRASRRHRDQRHTDALFAQDES